VSPPVDRRVLVGGAGLAGVLLGWALLVTVFGGSGDGGGVTSPSPAATAAATPESTVSPTPGVTYVRPGRDPFHQNVTVPRAPLPGQTSLQGAPVQTSVQGAPAASTPATRPPSGVSDTTARLELKSIAPDATGTVRATITVDGRPYSPAKGETFSHGYRLERIDGNCVDVSAQSARAQMCVPATKA
jgi:hypothetical protein